MYATGALLLFFLRIFFLCIKISLLCFTHVPLCSNYAPPQAQKKVPYQLCTTQQTKYSLTKAVSVYIQRPAIKICIHCTAQLVLKQKETIRINIQQVTWCVYCTAA